MPRATPDTSAPPRPRGLSVHLRGHLLLFDKRPAAGYDGSVGGRLLLIFIILEAAGLVVVRRLYQLVPLWFLIPLQLAFALMSVRFVAGLRLSQIGLRPWREWSATEKSYFLQLLVIANVVFPVAFAGPLRTIGAQPSIMSTVWSVFVPYLFFGFYQEVVYRGILQSELVRRWGALPGILVSNLLYTFGPLHSYYLSSRASLAIPMFASIFAIGLLAYCSGGRGICGSSRSFMALATHTSSGASDPCGDKTTNERMNLRRCQHGASQLGPVLGTQTLREGEFV